MDPLKSSTQPPKPAPLDAKLCEELALPTGDVLLRRIGGPNGLTSHFGKVKRGRIYCLSAARASRVMDEMPDEFEPVFQAHRTLIEAASKKAKSTAASKK